MRCTHKLAIVLLVALLIWPALAQKSSASPAPKYDLSTETTVKGSIEEVRELDQAGQPAIHLMLKTGDQVLEVYLCPNAFLKEMEFGFKAGDEVQVLGSKVKVGEAEVMLAREIVKGNDTLTLRDKKGAPVWTPLKKG